MNFEKFKLLMWKNYRLRRYHWVVTLIEFIIPILVVCIVARIVSSLPKSTITEKKIYSSTSEKKFVDDAEVNSSVVVYYAPNVPAINQFMEPLEYNFESMEGLANETELESTLGEHRTILTMSFGIFFQNIIYNESLPDKLTYVIRSRYDRTWNTRKLYSPKDTFDLDVRNPYIDESRFVAVQLLINNHFVRNKTALNASFEVEFERFPYPSFRFLDIFTHTKRASLFLVVGAVIVIVILIASVHLINDIVQEKDSGVKVTSNTSCIATVATSIFLLCFLFLLVGIMFLDNAVDNLALRLATLTPAGAFILIFNRIRYHEEHGIDTTWSSVAASVNDRNSVSLMFCLFMLVVDTCLYFFLAYYITAINPGKFGARKSPLFIFESLFSCFFTNDTEPLQNLNETAKSNFFEPPPQNVESTIQIKNLHKYFGNVYAVRGVDMNIYKSEMTVLLGCNGAGKTTTMSIMTGLISPSAGSIHFKGMDIFKNMDKFRRNLGMCPQENRTMPYLTVLEHLLFFGQLKGISRAAALAEANEYLAIMEMQSKKNSLIGALSGGMKRKLCLAIALMGKAEVLILDEPTSGMDAQSRRKLWDLLLGLRGQRTVIFTTHHMEEADALGDRIAIMDHGVIVCHGTPLFLKKAYGIGYELTITKDGGDSAAIDNVIKAALPDASRERETSTETIYKLPLTETSKFPTLFKNLEAEKLQLGIRNLGVAATTMENVFLKVGGVSTYDADSTKYKTVTDSNSGTNHLHYYVGAFLYVQQFKAIFKKKCLYTSRNLFSIFTRIILTSLMGLFMAYVPLLNQVEVDHSPEPPLDLSMSTYPGPTVVLKNNVIDSSFAEHLSEYVSEEGGLLVNANISPIEEDLLQYGNDILKYERDYISAFELNSTTVKVLNNPSLIHSFPITITTYTNVLLRSIMKDNRYQINTINHPIPSRKSLEDSENGCFKSQVLDFSFYILWFIAMAFYTVDLTAYFAVFVNTERIDGFQHIQTMSNVSPLVYWIATLSFDLAFFLLVIFIRVGVFKLVDKSTFLGLNTSIGIFALIIILYGISGLLFIYVISYFSSSKEGSYSLHLIFNVICCIIILVFYGLLGKVSLHNQLGVEHVHKLVFRFIVKGVILLVPSFNFSLLFFKFIATFQAKAGCSNCYSEASRENCEERNPIVRKPYFVFESDENKDGILLETLFLIFDIILYAIILSFINTGFVRNGFNSLKNRMFGTLSTNPDEGDDDVKQEYDKVQKYKKDESDHVSLCNREQNVINGKLSDVEIGENVPLRERNTTSLLVDGLRNNYINWLKPFTAVSDVNFIIKPGECFGLLGVNGAGKTTTFKMLTAEIVPTLGDASIETIKLRTNKMRYLSMAGYCPQTNCFIEELTGREMLSMIASMRGVFQNEIELLVDKWIKIIGLEEFQNRRCGTYSGGNKRKLCTAMSLIGDPKVIFLDEPTSGLDPVSRRNLYDVMAQSKEAGQAVILTSHSMEEYETLCDRLTIMVSGVMKCIGTTQHLKKKYAQGFSIMIKINDIPEFDGEKAALKNTMMELFTEKYCILKDEHRGLLYYQIKDTSIPWWALFEKMEALKQRYRDLVEDYVITDTTLEEVFISFAKESADLNLNK
ncbi:retinal-specific phospholipid-transporting ATPase ABCA4-like [Planococcus citri]|uniref:retinal-specific phospholipid-transporting ATPase ABCA4-like n=1 Tax=Planococcus citri TaxID=170843 RepID=UPI0031F76FB9